jgi:hypothetical protein
VTEEELSPEERHEDELKWALKEVRGGRGVILGPSSGWGPIFTCCTKCGFVHVNPVRVRYRCHRCGHLGKVGDWREKNIALGAASEKRIPKRRRWWFLDIPGALVRWWLRILGWPFEFSAKFPRRLSSVTGCLLALIWWPVWFGLTLVALFAPFLWLT